MTGDDSAADLGAELKADLQRYLAMAHEAAVWKLHGLSDYDQRRPVTRTGTNLLGLIKHLASVESEYLGSCFGRPFPEPMPWTGDDAPDDADMWATPDESGEYVVGLYRRVWAHSDRTLDELDLDAVGEVPWWPVERRRVTLGRVVVHVLAELNRHAGHLDIVRETIDGNAGHREDFSNLADRDAAGWHDLCSTVQRAADAFRD